MCTKGREHMKIPLTIERQLQLYAEDEYRTERHEVLWHTWKQNKRWIVQLLEGVMNSFPTYSKHNETHAQTVMHNIEMILGEDRIESLSASDCFLILHTVYIHDIGMLITSSERREIVTNDRFIRMVDYLEEEGDGSLRRAVNALKRNSYYYEEADKYEVQRQLYEDKLEVYNALIHLIANYRRSEHGEKARDRLSEWITKPDKLGTGFSLAGIPQRIFMTIAECARLHTEPEFEKIMELPQEDDGYIFDYMHPRFASVLLQLGDILDIDNDRFHPLVVSCIEDMPESSQIHYRKHLSVRKLLIRPDTIEITADCETQEALRVIRRECDMLIGILQKAGYAWSSICPSGFLGALPSVKSVDLQLKGQKIPQELVTAKFNISQKRAFEILEGSSLYNNRFAFLREFLQNALDATKLQYWKECTSTAEFYNNEGIVNVKSPYELKKFVETEKFPIEIEMEISKRNEKGEISVVTDDDIEDLDNEIMTGSIYGVKVRIKDFGIGIDQESLQRITKVGTSIDKEKRHIREMPVWLKPTAEFGVGLQSAFLVTSTFKCRTYTRSEERYEITFGSGSLAQYEGYINVRPVTAFEQKDDTYGTCFEIFVPEDKKMRHEEFPSSWDGEDIFCEGYERRRPVRHAAELMSQMTLILDGFIGESLFPIHLSLKAPKGIVIPVEKNGKNRVRALRLRMEEKD